RRSGTELLGPVRFLAVRQSSNAGVYHLLDRGSLQLPGEPASQKTNFKRRRAMRPITTKVAFVLAVVTMVGGIAWATSVHLKNNRNPNFTDNTGLPPSHNLTLTTSGALAGLGNGDVVIALTANANPTGQCCNPSGECKVPGHNP